jgi:hypothetical protein
MTRTPPHDLISKMSHVVVAPDKFKGTLTAALLGELAGHIARDWLPP